MSYYDPKDRSRLTEIGKFKPELMEKFLEYYGAVFSEDGALTKREKGLIALTIAHLKECPYCIDVYTNQCLENGCNPDEMTEALHVGASMESAMALIHGVQMHNSLKKQGAL